MEQTAVVPTSVRFHQIEGYLSGHSRMIVDFWFKRQPYDEMPEWRPPSYVADSLREEGESEVADEILELANQYEGLKAL